MCDYAARLLDGLLADTQCQWWQVMTEAGPWHARTLSMGSKHMSPLKQEFLAASPDTVPIVHYPCARLIVIQKPKAAL